MRRRPLILAVGSWSALVTALASGIPALAQSTSILVGAAGSLQTVLTEIDTLFIEAHPEIKVEYTFANSGSVQQQVEQGAPLDLVFFAAANFMDTLQDKNLIVEGSRQDLLSNRMALIVPQDSAVAIEDLADLTEDGIEVLSIGDLQAVPAGRYAGEILTEAGVFAELRLVFASTVREILTAVEQGNADAGILFASDAQLSDQVRVVTIADPLTPIVYPAAIIKDSDAAQTYLEYLTGEEATEVFLQYGFSTL